MYRIRQTSKVTGANWPLEFRFTDWEAANEKRLELAAQNPESWFRVEELEGEE